MSKHVIYVLFMKYKTKKEMDTCLGQAESQKQRYTD